MYVCVCEHIYAFCIVCFICFHAFSPDPEDTVVHEFATLCLVSLSVDFTCKVQIFDNKGLPPLIQLLSSPDPDVTKNTVETIFNLVQVDQHHQYNGVMSHKSPNIQIFVVHPDGIS